jgi:hypothetical protein
MSDAPESIAYSLDILSPSELAPFRHPSTFYPIDADPLFIIPWDSTEISFWPDLPGYRASTDLSRVIQLLQQRFPVFFFY